MTEEPLYVHDCEKCVYLGRFPVEYGGERYEGGGRENDLYWCSEHPRMFVPTRTGDDRLIRRFSDSLAPQDSVTYGTQGLFWLLHKNDILDEELESVYILAAERACRRGLASKLEAVLASEVG